MAKAANVQKRSTALPFWGFCSIGLAMITFIPNYWVQNASFFLVISVPIISIIFDIIGVIKHQRITGTTGIVIAMLSMYLPGWFECFVDYVPPHPFPYCEKMTNGEVSRLEILFN